MSSHTIITVQRNGHWEAEIPGLPVVGKGDDENAAIAGLAILLAGRLTEQAAGIRALFVASEDLMSKQGKNTGSVPFGPLVQMSEADLTRLREQQAMPMQIVQFAGPSMVTEEDCARMLRTSAAALATVQRTCARIACKASHDRGVRVIIDGAPCIDREVVARCVFQAVRSNGMRVQVWDAQGNPLPLIDPGEHIRRLRSFNEAQCQVVIEVAPDLGTTTAIPPVPVAP